MIDTIILFIVYT